jgi:hypothetical protein
MSDPDDELALTDADWAEINRLKRILETEGSKALKKALVDMAKMEPVRYVTITAVFFPEKVYNSMKDFMAAEGITEDDLIERVRKAAPTKH